jgi:hypothetical protein
MREFTVEQANERVFTVTQPDDCPGEAVTVGITFDSILITWDDITHTFDEI